MVYTLQMSKLEKFKRRLIRSVAKLLIEEKKPENEVWEILQNEIGKNCKVLWERMRALTLKKLRRLLAAEDKTALIPKFAQMSDTDWLFFDLIITHEDEDVIGKDELYDSTWNSKVLTDLFMLVQRFNIEGMQAEKLAEAWTAVTIFYNSSGHQCSPMLMQRRWYQLKQCTRERFYSFWFSYRGSLSRYWHEAQYTKPNTLQRAIAEKYPHVVTSQFPPWEELINSRLVILPEELEIYKSKTDLPKPCDENSPELLLLEPVIETIDLEEYISDEEKKENEISQDLSNDKESVSSHKVKLEPEEPEGIPSDKEFDEEQSFKCHISMEVMSSLVQEETLLNMNDEEIESHVICPLNATNTPENEETQSYTNNEEKNISQTLITEPIQEDVSIVESDTISKITTLTTADSLQESMFNVQNEEYQHDVTQTTSESFESGIPKITNVFGNIDITNEELIHSLTRCTNSVEERHDLPIISVGENEKECKTIHLDDSSDTDDVYIKDESFDPPKDNNETAENLSHSQIQDPVTSKTNNLENNETMKTKQTLFGGLRNYFDFKDDGIELVDDGIEYVEDDELEEKTDCYTPIKIETEDKEDICESDESKFDLKLLMQTSVYTTKLDDMTVLKDKFFDSVVSQSLIESITIESKPVCPRSLNIPNCFNANNSVDGDILIDDDNSEFDDMIRFELSSNLFKKPRSRTYNPIKLCKNPDFNTRLKRLTVGFLSSSRNRFLLKLCKPLTIDMSKSFEPKLVNGTIYLKNSNTTIETTNDGNDNKTASVVPSAMSVQSLIDNMVLQTLPADLKSNEQPKLVCSFDGSLAERNMVVNLPDMNKANVINQQLHTEQLPNYYSVDLDGPPLISDNNCSKDIANEDKVLNNTPNHVINYKAIEEQSIPSNLDNLRQVCIDRPFIPPSNSTSSHSDVMNKISKKKNMNASKQIPWRYDPKGTKISWLKKRIYTKENDALITPDTLHKMLAQIIGTNEVAVSTTNKAESKKKRKEKTDQKLEDKAKETDNNTVSKNTDGKMSDTEQIIDSIKKPKITVLYAKDRTENNGSECCWARTRINLKKTKLKKYYFKHTCKRNNCVCCCKVQLRDLLSNIRAENALKSACDSIESVVQQTRELIAVQTHEVIEPITATIPEQTNVDLSDDLSGNEMSDKINRKQVTQKLSCDLNKDSSINNVEPILQNRPPQICTPLATSTSVTHSLPVPQSIQTLQISASSTESDPNDKSKFSTHKISICAKKYSQKYKNISGQLFNNKLSDNVNTDSNKSKQNNSEEGSKNRIMILKRRHLSGGRTENPIHLGKNQILVTNVKIPSPITSNQQTPNKLEDMQCAPALPKGVHLTLSPTGELMCNILPGVAVDTNSLCQLPSIMAAVQEQLNISGVPVVRCDPIPKVIVSNTNSEEVLDICENESESSKEITSENSDLVSSKLVEEGTVILNNTSNVDQNTSSQKVVETENRKPNCEKQVLEISTRDKQVILNNVENIDINVASQITNVTSEIIQLPTTGDHTLNESSDTKQESMKNIDNSEENAKTPTDCNDTLSRNRKTLLSDLMEMSGISAEDIASTDNITQQISDIPPLVPLSLQSIVERSGNVPVSSNYSHTRNKIITKLPLPITDPEGTTDTLSLPELNTITSITDLKYACERNGSFFKLDYKTGTIVPITVCIKKTARSADNRSESVVIDLTEENDDIEEEEERNKQPSKSPKRSLILKTVKAKPLKIFRANHRPIILQKRSLQKTYTIKHTTNSLLKSNNVVGDSDNTTDNICFINSSEDESSQRKRTYSSDSSDDEPLISLVKRKKNDIDKKNNENELDLTKEESTNTEKPSTDDIMGEVEFGNEYSKNTMTNQHTELSTTLSIVLDHTYAEEDCILGV